MKKNILIITPKLTLPGGVSSYWNAIIPEMNLFFNIFNFEIGDHNWSIYGPILDQIKLGKFNKKVDLALLNPSIVIKSFYRDAFFALVLYKKKIPFIVFFRGWNLKFEKKITKRYIKFFLYTFGKAKSIIVLSEDFKNKILEWGYKGDIIVETTTVDYTLLRNFSIEKKIRIHENSNKMKILFLSRIVKGKGLKELIIAFRNLNLKYKNIELIIAGDGEDFEFYKKIVKKDDNIVMTGFVEGDEKIKLLTESNIFCLPSYSEGLPNSVMEAMAFGLPIITTTVGGLKDMFIDGEMGYMIPPKSVRHLKEKLELLIKDNQRAIDFGKFNHYYANNYLLSNKVAERLQNIILNHSVKF